MLEAVLFGQLTWNIPLLIIFNLTFMLYMYFVWRNWKRIKRIQPILFFLGIGLFYAITGSPLLTISYLSFSFHMIQMSILYFIVPPLLLLGIPQVMYQQITPFLTKWRFRFVTPVYALITFGFLFLLYHLPFILILITKYDVLQKGYITLLLLLSFRMWWPIVSPHPGERFLAKKRKKYVWQSSIYIMPACILFIVSAFLDGMNNPFLGQMTAHLCLPENEPIQLLPPPFNTKYDQMSAGVVMLTLHKMSIKTMCKLEKRC